MDRLEPISLRWAQGVGRSNRPAPTNKIKGFSCSLLAAAKSAVVDFVATFQFLKSSSNLDHSSRRSFQAANPLSLRTGVLPLYGPVIFAQEYSATAFSHT